MATIMAILPPHKSAGDRQAESEAINGYSYFKWDCREAHLNSLSMRAV